MAPRPSTSVLRTLRPSLPRHSAAVSLSARRSLATVQSGPTPGQEAAVRKTGHGGLRDQDRIFTNAYMRHDHGIKGAMVSRLLCESVVGGLRGRGWETRLELIGVRDKTKLTTWPSVRNEFRNVEIGTGLRTLSKRVTRGLFSRLRTPDCVDGEELVSHQDSSGHS